eukprot:403345828
MKPQSLNILSNQSKIHSRNSVNGNIEQSRGGKDSETEEIITVLQINQTAEHLLLNQSTNSQKKQNNTKVNFQGQNEDSNNQLIYESNYQDDDEDSSPNQSFNEAYGDNYLNQVQRLNTVIHNSIKQNQQFQYFDEINQSLNLENQTIENGNQISEDQLQIQNQKLKTKRLSDELKDELSGNTLRTRNNIKNNIQLQEQHEYNSNKSASPGSYLMQDKNKEATGTVIHMNFQESNVFNNNLQEQEDLDQTLQSQDYQNSLNQSQQQQLNTVNHMNIIVNSEEEEEYSSQMLTSNYQDEYHDFSQISQQESMQMKQKQDAQKALKKKGHFRGDSFGDSVPLENTLSKKEMKDTLSQINKDIHNKDNAVNDKQDQKQNDNVDYDEPPKTLTRKLSKTDSLRNLNSFFRNEKSILAPSSNQLSNLSSDYDESVDDFQQYSIQEQVKNSKVDDSPEIKQSKPQNTQDNEIEESFNDQHSDFTILKRLVDKFSKNHQQIFREPKLQEKYDRYQTFDKDQLLEKLAGYMNKNSKLEEKVKYLLENNHALAQKLQRKKDQNSQGANYKQLMEKSLQDLQELESIREQQRQFRYQYEDIQNKFNQLLQKYEESRLKNKRYEQKYKELIESIQQENEYKIKTQKEIEFLKELAQTQIINKFEQQRQLQSSGRVMSNQSEKSSSINLDLSQLSSTEKNRNQLNTQNSNTRQQSLQKSQKSKSNTRQSSVESQKQKQQNTENQFTQNPSQFQGASYTEILQQFYSNRSNYSNQTKKSQQSPDQPKKQANINSNAKNIRISKQVSPVRVNETTNSKQKINSSQYTKKSVTRPITPIQNNNITLAQKNQETSPFSLNNYINPQYRQALNKSVIATSTLYSNQNSKSLRATNLSGSVTSRNIVNQTVITKNSNTKEHSSTYSQQAQLKFQNKNASKQKQASVSIVNSSQQQQKLLQNYLRNEVASKSRQNSKTPNKSLKQNSQDQNSSMFVNDIDYDQILNDKSQANKNLGNVTDRGAKKNQSLGQFINFTGQQIHKNNQSIQIQSKEIISDPLQKYLQQIIRTNHKNL